MVTAGVVLARLGPPPPIRFFTPAEQAVGAALFDQLLDQREAPKVPVLEMVDARLAEAITDGWRYEDMPEDGAAFRATFAFLDEDAERSCGAKFHQLPWHEQAALIQRVQDLNDHEDEWHGLPAKHVWSLWTRYACAAFYSHPWSWNEIGFGGPAYPRGYAAFGTPAFGEREHWEKPEAFQRDPVSDAKRKGLD